MLEKQERIHRAENVALDKVLRRVLRKSGVPNLRPASADTGGPLQILNLACGSCREAGVLVKVFGDVAGEGRDVRLVGADIRHRELEEATARARELVRTTGRTGDQFEFLPENCARLDRHKELGKDFDVTFLRHQNYWNNKTLWQRIFEQGLEKLKDDGMLVITSYFDREHALALNALAQAGAELIVTEQNEDTRLLSDAPGKSVDRHVAIFRKKL